MSGYDPKLNIFEMTGTKLRYWLRPRTLPAEYYERDPETGELFVDEGKLIERLLREQGCRVMLDGGNYLVIFGEPEKIWQALSGQPSKPERANHYRNNPTDCSRYAHLLTPEERARIE